MKYLKHFDTIAEYNTYKNSNDFVTPNVSDVEEDPTFVEFTSPTSTPVIPELTGAKILCKYNVTDTDDPIDLYYPTDYDGEDAFMLSSTMIVDDEEYNVRESYTFDTIGEHTVLFTLAEGVTSIGYQAFYGCSGLTSVTIGNSVTSIGVEAFQDCSGLTNVTIGNAVTLIDDRAFSGCSGLTNVTIGSSVTSIGASAFSGCSGLTSITIPDSVTSISNYSFSDCSGLTSIICNATTAPTITSFTFQDINSGGTLTVPTGSTGYDVWMGTGNYYLGKYGWTKVEQ